MPPEGTVWIDLLHPDDHERQFISTALSIDLPDFYQMQEIEASSRLYTEGGAHYLTTDILVGFDTPDSALDTLLIVVTPRCLVTVRYCEPRSIKIFAARIQIESDLICSTADGLISLLDAITDRTADIIEILGDRTDVLSRQIFRRPVMIETNKNKAAEAKTTPSKREHRLQEILSGIGLAGDSTHKVRDSINSLVRLTTFLGHRLVPGMNGEQTAKFRAVENDLRSLSEHAQFVAHETAFLLDATLGQINIEQNNIIKIFSLVMVAFTPPTFFASMWGMNFHNMPEYALDAGYPIALSIMAVSAIMPLIYFKKRGWM